MFQPDMRTIALLLVLVCMVSTFLTIMLWRQYHTRYNGTEFWIADLSSQLLTALLIAFRGALPQWLSIDIANTLSIAGIIFGLHGLLAFAGVKRNQIFNYSLLALYLIVQTWFTYRNPDLSARNLNTSVFSLIFFGQSAWFIFAGAPVNIRKLSKGAGLVFIGFTALSGIRIIRFFVYPDSAADYFQADPFEKIVLIILLLLTLFLIYTLILMYSRRLLQDIRSEEQKFSTVFHTSPYCVQLTKLADGMILEVNDGFESVFGHTKESIRGRTTSDLGIWINESDRLSFVKKLTSKQSVHDQEYSFRKQDGTIFTGSISARIINIDSSDCILSSIIDISERKKADERLKRSEKNLADAERISNSCSWSYDKQTHSYEWSDNAYNLFDIDRSSPIDYSRSDFVRTIVHPADHEQFLKFIDDAHKGIGEKSFVYRIIRKDGRIRYIQTLVEPVMSRNNRVVKIYGKVQDITEKKLADDDLKASEEKFRDLFENSPLGNSVSSLNGNIEVNNSFCKMTGYSKEELTGTNWGRITHPDDLQKTEDAIRLMLSGKTDSIRLIKRYIRKDGTILHAEVSAYLHRDQGGEPKFFISTINDISDRIVIEEEMRKFNEELEQRVEDRTRLLEESHEKLVAANKDLESFTYSVSHDLRAPLRAIDGYSSLLHMEYSGKLDQDGDKMISSILRNTRKMSTLIDDLLSFSRIGRSQMKLSLASMGNIVESVYNEITENRETVKIDFHLDAIPDIMCDPGLMRQVWINLISNAIKFSSRAELIKISVSSISKPDLVVYSIRDNGVGFDMKYYHKLFGVFERLHRADEFEGTGVGLAIVKRIIGKHGGEVWAESAPGEGTSFHFSLPYLT